MTYAEKLDPEIEVRAVGMLREHPTEYGSVTKTPAMVGQQLHVSPNTRRRWVVQAETDDGQREGVPPVTLEELAASRPRTERLYETPAVLRRNSLFCAVELDPPPQPLIKAFSEGLPDFG